MTFNSWLDGLKSAARNRRTRRAQRGRTNPARADNTLRVERLEDRTVPTFAVPVNYPTDLAPQAIVSGYFNADSDLDLAVANYSNSTVSVLLGNGDGTFQPAVNSDTGYLPLSLAVGDFNEDGKLDLASANVYDVSVMLGNGDGTFGTPASIGLGSSPQSVAVGDFNGDGTMDLGVTANLFTPGYYGPGYWGYWGYYPGNYYPGYYNGSANVLIGNGLGDFSGPNTTDLGYGYHTTATTANLNGDGVDDFVTFNLDYGAVNVLRGDVSGYLQYYSDLYTGGDSYSVAAGDVNADGDTDLVTANFYGNSVSVLHGSGTGTFSSPVGSATGANPWSLAAADFDGDGWLDAATANNSGNDVSVLMNDGNWPPPPPSVSINDVTVTEGNAGSTNATFTLTLSSAYSTPITVHFATANGTAAAGSDYTTTSGDVTFAPWQTTRDVTVPVLGDSFAEPTEYFVVNLSTSDAPLGDGQGVGTILDNDPRISINDVTVTEGNTGTTSATFTVSLPYAYSYPITFHYQTADGSGPGSATAGSDYSAASGDVTFAVGQTSKPIPIAVIGDRSAEPTETFVVNLITSDAAVTDGQGLGTILDNEPRVSVNDVTVTERNTGTVNATFTVTLSVAYDEAVLVPYGTANGTATSPSDYTAAPGSVTIPAGSRTNTFSVAVLADTLVESTETFFVNLSAPPNAAISDGQGVGTIRDYATSRFSINDVSVIEGSSASRKLVFTVTRSGAVDQTVTVNFATANGTATTADKDYQAGSGTLTFAPGEMTKTITVIAYGDKKREADETFFINLSGASSNAMIDDALGIGTIFNDD